MANTKITLPTIDEDKREPFAVTDWARGNGAWNSSHNYEIKGVAQKGGYGWSRVADDDESIECRDNDGGSIWDHAGNREVVARPRFQNPEQSQIDTSAASGEEKFLTLVARPLIIQKQKSQAVFKLLGALTYLSQVIKHRLILMQIVIVHLRQGKVKVMRLL